MVNEAAESLEVQQSVKKPARWEWFARRAQLLAGAAVVLLACSMAVGASAFLYEHYVLAAPKPAVQAPALPPQAASPVVDRALPASTAYTILVGAYPLADPQSAKDIRATTEWLEASGIHVYYAPIDSASGGRWQRVLAGAYEDDAAARADVERLKAAAPALDAQVVAAGAAGGPGAAPGRAAATGSGDTDIVLRRAGMNP
jgi:hypothetical protein